MKFTLGFLLFIFIGDYAKSCAPKGNNGTSTPMIGTLPPFIFPSLLSEPNNDTLVETSSGILDGYYMETITGKKIFAFEGIPYAEPPIGCNRFRDPVPKSPWDGIRQAKAPGSDCLQLNFVQLLTIIGNEDCLTLNVYSPMLPNETHDHSLPVMVYIHGGFFLYGSGREYGPYYLASSSTDVILVTMNYRLGALGFLSTGYEGNYGLKDQALAIKWVHDNIKSFGGDPSRITLFGQSSGAVSVHLQMLATNSVAKGLFSAAIALSGSAFNHWGLQNQTYAMKMTTKLSKLINCPVDSGNENLLNCLRYTNPNFIVAAQRWLWDLFLFPVVLFGPVIQSKQNNNSFIDDLPENNYARKQVAQIPFICSTTREEAEFFILVLQKTLSLGLPLNHYKKYGHIFMDFRDGLKYSTEETNNILLHHYYGTQNILFKSLKILGAMASDRYFHIGIRRALKFHSQVARTYSYVFNFTSPSGVAQKLLDDYRNWGSMHGEDISIILNSTTPFDWLKKDNETLRISEILVDFLTSFADTRFPVLNENTVENKEFQWTPITDAENLQFLRIANKDLKMIEDPFKDRISIWESLGIY